MPSPPGGASVCRPGRPGIEDEGADQVVVAGQSQVRGVATTSSSVCPTGLFPVGFGSSRRTELIHNPTLKFATDLLLE